jgi:hypothetical protein
MRVRNRRPNCVEREPPTDLPPDVISASVSITADGRPTLGIYCTSQHNYPSTTLTHMSGFKKIRNRRRG